MPFEFIFKSQPDSQYSLRATASSKRKRKTFDKSTTLFVQHQTSDSQRRQEKMSNTQQARSKIQMFVRSWWRPQQSEEDSHCFCVILPLKMIIAEYQFD